MIFGEKRAISHSHAFSDGEGCGFDSRRVHQISPFGFSERDIFLSGTIPRGNISKKILRNRLTNERSVGNIIEKTKI